MDEEELKIAIGLTIRHFRNENNLSQEELASISGLHRTYIGALERGEKSPTIPTMVKVTTSLEINLVTFFKKLQKELKS